MKLRGVIQKGVGQGSFFTSLPWVKEQYQKAMGFSPYPGTVNVRISEEDLSQMDDFFSTKDFEIVPTDPKFCAGSFKKVYINGIPGAAVFPSEDVRVHGKESFNRGGVSLFARLDILADDGLDRVFVSKEHRRS